MGYPVWGFRFEKKSPDFRSPEVGISVTDEFSTAEERRLNQFGSAD